MVKMALIGDGRNSAAPDGVRKGWETGVPCERPARGPDRGMVRPGPGDRRRVPGSASGLGPWCSRFPGTPGLLPGDGWRSGRAADGGMAA